MAQPALEADDEARDGVVPEQGIQCRHQIEKLSETVSTGHLGTSTPLYGLGQLTPATMLSASLLIIRKLPTVCAQSMPSWWNWAEAPGEASIGTLEGFLAEPQ